MTRPLRVCFHAALLWPLWSGGRIAFTGGAEVQQAQIAKGFAARGIEMTVVTCDYGQASPTTVDGVRVLKTYRIEDGPPVLRFFHPRLTRTMSVLHAATADVYYARGGNLEAGEAYLAARRRGAAFVFGAAHDHDARASLPKLGSPRDRWLYRRALRGADAIVAQTIAQQELFRAEFGLESLLVLAGLRRHRQGGRAGRVVRGPPASWPGAGPRPPAHRRRPRRRRPWRGARRPRALRDADRSHAPGRGRRCPPARPPPSEPAHRAPARPADCAERPATTTVAA